MTRRWFIVWLLTGPAIGLTLVVLPNYARTWLFAAAIFLDTGHSLSPIALAWTTGGFRRLMCEQPWRYIGLPLAILAAAIEAGIMANAGDPALFDLMLSGYLVWNVYHFGMQNFGILQLHSRGRFRRRNLALGLGGTVIGFGVPSLLAPVESSIALAGTGIFAFHHWLTDIVLSSRASRYGWGFALGVMLLGALGFVWLFPVPYGQAHRLLLGPSLRIILGARLGLGFVHFLYSRWVWRSSSPFIGQLIEP